MLLLEQAAPALRTVPVTEDTFHQPRCPETRSHFVLSCFQPLGCSLTVEKRKQSTQLRFTILGRVEGLVKLPVPWEYQFQGPPPVHTTLYSCCSLGTRQRGMSIWIESPVYILLLAAGCWLSPTELVGEKPS